MASTSTQMVSSSSSSSTPPKRYDVFLSFYGKDTRKSFTDHLYATLIQKGIIVFRDDEKLERGKTISKELIKAIQESMYAIVVISPNYASSRWCLIELAKIVECMKYSGLKVMPIFYHVDPSHLRNQKGTFAKAFGRHKKEKDPKIDINEMQMWRAALREVGNISGWHVLDSHESKVVEEISRMIFRGLVNFSNASKGLVGIESHAEEIMSKLCIGFDDVRFLGIHGMGGIGKTTLSKFIYERVSHQFEASCFITSIREETRTDYDLVYLQKQLISEILLDKEINIWNSYEATRVIANRLRNKKVLIVLDDVDGEKQLKALAESHDWFGQGSRIIITSRDRHLLNKIVDITYDVMVLNDAEALQLFSLKAFKKPRPEENYVQLSMNIVNYAQGLPLALEVFGSLLFGRTMDEWKSARDLLKENPNVEILDKLKISYDGLEDLQQKLFLDIACFFNGAYIHGIRYKLESFGYYPDFNMRVLVDKSLITMSEGLLQMHDLLRKMGQKIVRCESIKEEPGECSRLWCNEDVIRVLKNDSGTDAVRGIVLKLPLQKQERLNVEAFSKMKQLQMLEISNPNIESRFSKARDDLRTLKWHGDPSNFILSNELCVMEWRGYPLESLPASFQSNKLVELTMPNSCIKQLWDGRKSFDKLKRIRLSHSKNLIETPDLSGVPNLEQLELQYCTRLCKVHPSIGFLKRLKCLYLQGCKRLKRLPDEMISLSSLVSLDISHCSRLEEVPKYMISGMKCLELLFVSGSATRKFPIGSEPYRLLIPNSFSCLSSLSYLELSYCNLSDGAIPSDFSYLSSLWYLNLSGNKFTRIPYSAWQLSSLQRLDLSYCNLLDGAIPNDLSCLSSLRSLKLSGNKFTRIPYGAWQLSSLKWLDVSCCNLLDGAIPNDLSCLSSLIYLGLSGNKFTRIPYSVWQLSSLVRLDLSYCNLLDGAIPNDLSCLSPLYSLKLSGNKFTRIPDSVAQLSCLYTLELDDCRWLQVLPKLPLRLKELSVRNCQWLELFYNQMDMWITSNEKLRSNIDCSVVQAYIDYDGKPFKILHLHPQSPLWSEESVEYFDAKVACGPALVGSGIPEWFNDKSTNSFGTIQLHSDLGLDQWWLWWDWMGYAVFIVYEFHEPHTTHPRKSRKRKVDERKGNSNSTTFNGSNSNFPYFLCQFQVNGVDVKKPLVLCAPGVPSIGPNGFWVYIPPAWWFGLNELGNRWRRSVEASITTDSLNVEVKECGARLLRDEHDAFALYQLLNTISPPPALGLRSYENLFSHFYEANWSCVWVNGPIKSNVVASGSIGSVNCKKHLDVLKKKQKYKIRLIGNRLMGVKGKPKTLTFPSQRIRGELTKKRKSKEQE